MSNSEHGKKPFMIKSLNNFNSSNVSYILAGIVVAFVGLLVHDRIRERIKDQSFDESVKVVSDK